MSVVLGGFTPHPPSLIPEVGREATAKLGRTIVAMKELARQVAAETPDVVVIASPHSPGDHDAFGVYGRGWHLGDFAHHQAPHVTLEAPGDTTLARAVLEQALADGLAVELADRERAVPLDYGVAVPLYYLQHAGYRGAVLPVTIARQDAAAHRTFGRAIARAASMLGKRVVLLASGDLAHSGEDAARHFDQLLLDSLSGGRWEAIYALKPEDRELAHDCAYEALMILLGALEGSAPRASLLSYQESLGVGYATVAIAVDEAGEQDVPVDPAGFARLVADTFLQTERLPPAPAHFPHAPRGCFVCLHHNGGQVACAGSLTPHEPNLATEIARHTLEALADYAEAVTPDRAPSVATLLNVSFTVYLVGEQSYISDASELAAGEGLLVQAGDTYGIALPAEAATPTAMLDLALLRAGLAPGTSIRLARFATERFTELARPAW